MLEMGQTSAAPATGDALVKEISEATFMEDVIEASKEVPVIVDFWAPWCGPCRTLGPALEAAVNAAGGKVKMVKINVDENQQVAGQLRVQSIPTVYAFHDGQPVDGFQGALPQSQVNQFVDKMAALAAEGPLAAAIASANEMLDAGALDDAAQTFAAIIEEDPSSAAAYAGLARVKIAEGELDEAEAILNGAPAEISHSAEIDGAHAKIALARQAAEAGPVEELRAKVAADPADHQARYDLAKALHASGDIQGAVDELLEVFRRDRDWNDGAAKTQLFTIFDALAANDPVALAGRRKLSSLMFA
ncbi:thioredoxin [Maritimibacter sp. HL-12]|jgi:putative thioredoxin|uniref:thioredoxin n=1 Tax=Maritimibacter sp. HL-12 TaxID=1162418 RepID=UPI000A0F31EE|nr:thioredoxin [Maritimibacter sp. HL-12]SMH43518.1 thioredoxin [Maritimibacter sp. HL-12]